MLALPAAFLGQAIFGVEAELIIHFVCAVGFALISVAVFDFKTPRWINWAGSFVGISLGAIFLLQGISQLIRNDSLRYLAFQVFGQRAENWLVKALMLWFAALLLFDSRGWKRILGVLVIFAVLCAEVYSYYPAHQDAPILKLLYLLPFVWLFFESKQGNTHKLKIIK